MSLSSKETADFLEWPSWKTKDKRKGCGGAEKEGRNKREKEGGREGKRKERRKKTEKTENRTKYMSFRVMRVVCAFLVML